MNHIVQSLTPMRR